jgi:cholesterol oxidase
VPAHAPAALDWNTSREAVNRRDPTTAEAAEARGA